MNDDFVSLFAYDRWANAKMLGACRQLTPEQYVAEPAPGWASVRATVHHIAIVTEGWMRGVKGEEVSDRPSEDDLPTVDDADRWLARAYEHFEVVASRLTPEFLATPSTFRGRGRSMEMAPWAVLRHIVNHGTYHRGQVSSKLKRHGVVQPETDFIFWAMEQAAR